MLAVNVGGTISANATYEIALYNSSLATIQEKEQTCIETAKSNYASNSNDLYGKITTCITNQNTLNSTVDQNQNGNYTDCHDDNGTHTQTSEDGSQSQTQTGPGCQSQNSQGNSGGTQTQCTGTDCATMQTLPPMTMAPWITMPTMKPLN